ncbi:L-seryl-tRNA(Sec) selenium transferase [Actinophytocola algeriensis]|uniref:L-seryl-tRNA(Sec) selenium transferase n=1 Tax=Actinophytocola algeriensis TaxID=1768010 RepID=A0A7W7VJ34_9PSEU|nr:L-seryl-tRNA(Sec) selenium transferase [Actinophytocola algeriensis]MBB4911670.1 L-seryl-tRNA(Ser) seleniumtransferase [Actinophytocola algeriensis]MBE1473342.1 L-seryl-tRNA(Ser) seleniumtransferase [Actinophytocola algeriensis]
MADPRRRIPRTDVLLADPRLADAVRRLGTPLVKAAITAAQDRARAGEIDHELITDHVVAALPATASALRRVVNATGVLVHTNLGRAPLSPAALDAVVAAGGTTDVEFDLTTGQRARRGRGALAALADAVPDAEAVHVVNNNAAALLLCAMTFAQGGEARRNEIVISKGELVEIGDGFRIPELLAATGARLREVGTTNRTSLADYAAAVGAETGFVLKVHPSNFQVTGFTSAPGVAELAGLGVPVIADIGSGLLRPDPLLPDEPDATTLLRAGAALVTASGDKLLGGPQAGLLLGRHDLVEAARRHPAARALRVGKLTMAALEATLRGPAPPVHVALHADPAAVRARVASLVAGLAGLGVDATAVDSVAVVGGGGAPGVELPSAAVSLPPEYAVRLRTGEPPVVGRVERGRCLLDLRTVATDDDRVLLDAVARCTS